MFFYIRSTSVQTARISFLDVGQGDSILIQTPHGAQILIDGGKDATVLRRLSEHLPLFDRTIDVVIATHPDADHVGGLVDVVKRYDVGHVYYTPMEHDTPQVELFENALAGRNISAEHLRAGDVLKLDDEIFLHILHPQSVLVHDDTNDSSVVAQFVYRDATALFTGDASVDIEYELVHRYGAALKSSILKLGHHGSYTSTSDIFLNFVKPAHVVISRGCDNEYGHPHREVTERLLQNQLQSFDTCDDGSITFETTGGAFTTSNE